MATTTLSVFAIQDISRDKSRRAPERIFFHDILSIAAGVRGLARLLLGTTAGELEDLHERILRLSGNLTEEISALRDLLAAETDELSVRLAPIHSWDLIEEILETYREHKICRDKVLTIDPVAHAVEFTSDANLLRRVLGSMAKNALEASVAGETVTIGSFAQDGWIEFRVHNSAVMPREAQLQVFQRSYSIKGIGRGFGTYSIKLLTERYLKGQVGFISTAGAGTPFYGGTTFYVRYPLTYPGQESEPRSGWGG